MAYLIHSIDDPIRQVASLTGPADAKPGQAAISNEGDIYVMTNVGWQQVYDHVNGTNFSPTIPLPSNKAVVTDAQTIAVTGGTVTLHVSANVVTASYAGS